jgi:hypothetical protein
MAELTGEQGDKVTRRARKFLVTFSPLLLVILVACATWKLALGERIIARGDLLLYFYPLRDFASQAIREGRLPLWNPYTFMGSPFLANSQAGFFYPFNVITAWLPVEQAASWNIALHVVIAALGAYALARVGFRLGRLAAFATGIAFGLGGYLGAQAEHLNQLQALAWLPLMVLTVADFVLDPASRNGKRNGDRGRFWIEDSRTFFASFLKRTLALTGLIALQVTAGHTQSLYISLITLGIVLVIQIIVALAAPSADPSTALRRRLMLRSPLCGLAIVVIAGALAALLTAIQLLPTLELSRESARAGGLPFNEAGSFSWRPWVIARALLPTYGDPLFPEYIAYFGTAGLALALLGAISPLPQPSPSGRGSRLIAIALVIAGFVLALGVVTPLFNALYRFLPGFNLFRAQARWLIVFALGMSLLVGLGVQRLRDGLTAKQARAWLIAWVGVMALLVIGLFIGARISPEPEYAALPARSVLLGWAIAAATVTVLIAVSLRSGSRDWRFTGTLQSPISNLFALALLIELLIASQFQPYSRAADRQALTSLRPSTAHLLAEQDSSLTPMAPSGPQVPSPTGRGERVLALSSLFFDPGDKVEQEMIFGGQLSTDEVYDRIIASKHKEVLSPNLSLYYRLPSVDGYDGGLLPTRRYADFVKQFASTPTGSVDGRLREFLKGVPDNKWLSQMGVRYVIADKTQDVFVDGVYYDLLFSAPIRDVLSVPLAPFFATALGLVVSVDGAQAGDLVATAEVTFDDGSAQSFDIRASAPVTPYFSARLDWGEQRMAVALNLSGLEDLTGLTLRGLTSIDATDSAFLSQMVRGDHDMRLVHSGDVKIYDNLRPVSRVTLRIGDGQVDIRQLGGQITEDDPEFVRIQLPEMFSKRPSSSAESQSAPLARLILRDACFPGWVARVDGVETPIECVDLMFRSVTLANGARTVEFSYEPASVRIGATLTLVGGAICLVLLVSTVLFQRRSTQRLDNAT